MEIKSNLLDRLDDTFSLIWKHFLWFLKYSLVLSLLWIISYFSLILSIIWVEYLIKIIQFKFLLIWIWVLYLIFLLIIIFVNIWLYLWLINYIKNIFNNEETSVLESVKYWLKNIWKSLNVYVIKFFYIFNFPIIAFFVISWIFLYQIVSNNNIISYKILISISIIFSIICWIYIIIKSVKSYFALINSVEYDSYNKANFKFLLKTSKWNLLRIFWNTFIFSIITWIIIWFWSIILWSIFYFSSFWNYIENYTQKNIEPIENNPKFFQIMYEKISKDWFELWIYDILNISWILNIIFNNFVYCINNIFIYLLFRAIVFEYTQKVEWYRHIDENEEEKEETI